MFLHAFSVVLMSKELSESRPGARPQLSGEKLSSPMPILHKINNLFTRNRYRSVLAELRYLALKTTKWNNSNVEFKEKSSSYLSL